jgi:hypothetical protein
MWSDLVASGRDWVDRVTLPALNCRSHNISHVFNQSRVLFSRFYLSKRQLNEECAKIDGLHSMLK